MNPLHDVRVIAIEQYGAGPFASLQLADLGADVIKIEHPASGGDVSRYVPPMQEEEDSVFFETFNRNKRSLGLDIRTEGGREVLEDLVRVSDALVSNLRGDVPAKLRIRYRDLADVNPAIVCVSLSGFGQSGPRFDQPGYDYIHQALAGWMALTGEPGAPPTKSGLSLVDYSGGLYAGIALLSGIHAARRDGIGMDFDLALQDVALAMLTYPAAWYLNGDVEPRRMGRSAHPSLVPFQLFQGSEGDWFVVACAKEKFWRRLTEVLDRTDLALDQRFVDFAARRRHRDELIRILDDVFASRGCADWVEALEAVGVPTARVATVPEALADPHVAARGLLIDVEHERFGAVRQVGSPLRLGEGGHRRAPTRGEDDEAILGELLAYDRRRIDELRRSGALG
jgi:crotonobetainyl-CoA:carnitine CoA-transferase CaiB-like acyl-CoA transferase